MNKSKLIATIGLALGIAATSPAFAHQRHESIDQRQHRQAQRLEHGIENGRLTRGEARRLWEQQRRIRALERRFRADGRLDRRERRVLQAKLDEASDAIYRLKHNKRERYREYREFRDEPGHRHPGKRINHRHR